jgi:hypothetical protein
MTVHQDTHNGSAKSAGRSHADGFAKQADDFAKDGFAKSVEAAEAALQEAGAGATSEGKAAITGMLASSREWMSWAQDAGQANMEAWQALLACRTPKAAMAIQSALFQEQFKLLAHSMRCTTMATWQTALKANDQRH